MTRAIAQGPHRTVVAALWQCITSTTTAAVRVTLTVAAPATGTVPNLFHVPALVPDPALAAV